MWDDYWIPQNYATKHIYTNLSGWNKHFGIYSYLHKNLQMHQNYHLIWCLVTRSYMFLHTNAIIREITWSSEANCRCTLQRNNGISSEVTPISNYALWMWVDMVNSWWRQWTVVVHWLFVNTCKLHLFYI
jgi:hypothetical protein